MRFRSSATLLCLWLLPSILFAGDWPQWRYDASRGNASPDALPTELQLQWVRHLPQPQSAWPASQTKLQFDATYQPIVVGDLLIVGSTVNDSVSAYDTSTGKTVWQFFTDGPVRFAPAAHNGKIYLGSDDGYVYCIEAKTAKLIWKRNGGPTDRRIIGNNRLGSSWPIRGGLVIAGRTVYFTAGIWPFMGVFIHALDAETGNTIWMNSETGSQWITHPHGAPSFGSVVPQGYLAVAGSSVIVPGGRSLPAVLNRGTGKLRHFQFGGKGSGGWNIAAHEDFYTVGNTILDIKDGTTIGSQASDVIGNGLLISGMTASSLHDAEITEEKVEDRRGKEVIKRQLKTNGSWQIGDDSWRALAMAGEQVYAGRRGKVACFNVNDARAAKKPQQPVWSSEIDGEPTNIVAGDGKLFVVTEEAKIHCFGTSKTQPTIFRVERQGAGEGDDEWTKLADEILRHEGTNVGYAIGWGLESGGLVEELLSRTQLQIIAIDPDATKIAELRRRWDAAGAYGQRVTAHVGEPGSYDLPPYLANLIFSEKRLMREPDNVYETQTALLKSLRPYGGVAIWPATITDHAKMSPDVINGRGDSHEFGWRSGQSFLKRIGPLPGSADWTHQYADAGNSVVSKDTLVKAPLGLLWYGGPPNDKVLPRHGHGPSPQVAGGRLVIEGADMLRCVDVYTGRVWWERDLPGLGTYYDTTAHFAGAGEIGSNYVTLGDAIYVVYGDAILDLDPATGEIRREFKLQSNTDNPNPTWGYIAAEGNLLVATSSPVKVEGSDQTNAKETPSIPKDMTPLIKPGDSWSYLAGSDPPSKWMSLEFKPRESWKSGTAGFGYGDNDDQTVLKQMKGKFQRVYIRKSFTVKDAANVKDMTLVVNYDDAFIAYLNGQEIVRAGVEKGAGVAAKNISGHEAGGHVAFQIEDYASLLKSGENVIAIEGHNSAIGSSDFTLDPYVVVKSDGAAIVATKSEPSQPKKSTLIDSLKPSRYSSGSRRLIVFDRHSSKELWSREAEFNFRHNAIAIAAGKVFCIDRMSDAKLTALKRRGIEPEGKPKLMALDGQTGRVVWSTEEDVFGTFLNYSSEHGILLQAGSKYRDRAKDESAQGMVAYRGDSGSVVWKNLSQSYGGPCLLWKDKIITNGGGGFQLELLTGKLTDWKYTRMYGCNTAVGSQHLLTFRSGAAGYCDLLGDSGTGNIGGFRSSCTANLIVADGVLNAPDYTRTCNCAYQNQSSLAMIHMPEAEMWTFSSLSAPPDNFGINLGAAGDRRDQRGTMWYELPGVGGKSPSLPVTIEGERLRYVRHHSSVVTSTSKDSPWIVSSCAVGVKSVAQKMPRQQRWTIRLYFAELENMQPGDRVFDVAINGKQRLENFDIVKSAKGSNREIVHEFSGIEAANIVVQFHAIKGEPCLSGFEVFAERE